MKYKVPFVNYPKHYKLIKKEIDSAIKRVLSSGDLILRQDVEQFEKNIAKFLNVKYALGVNSCTDALILSLRAAGIGPGDQVITVAHTFVASIAAIAHAGATPILVDIDDDYLMDPDFLNKVITKKTKAIIPVHLNGRVCQMDKIIEVAKKDKLIIIEDAAQALGAAYKGKKAGSFGLTGCFSFYPAKLLGAFGDAGIIVTNNKKIHEQLKLYRDHGRKTKEKIVCYGFTSRLDNLQAAILNVKFKRIRQWITRRRKLANIYNQGLKDIQEVTIPPISDNTHYDVYQNYVIRAKNRDQLKIYLTKQGIETIISNPIPVNKQKKLGLTRFKLPKTEGFAKEVVSLPLIPELTEQQIKYTVKTIKQFYAR
jgi:dTDP-4-amino-4,6-dideoxygalactose transaminase